MKFTQEVKVIEVDSLETLNKIITGELDDIPDYGLYSAKDIINIETVHYHVNNYSGNDHTKYRVFYRHYVYFAPEGETDEDNARLDQDA